MSNFKGPLLVVGMFLTTEYPLKWGKMLFISFKKLFTFLRLSLSSFLKFRSFLGYVEKHFDKMPRLISEFMTSKSGKQILAIHILSNISINKDNQAIKLGQFKKHDGRNIFLQKSCRKWRTITSSRPLFVSWKSFIYGQSKWSAP